MKKEEVADVVKNCLLDTDGEVVKDQSDDYDGEGGERLQSGGIDDPNGIYHNHSDDAT